MYDWLRRVFPRPSRATRRSIRPSFRPRLEILEDRFLLDAAPWTVNALTDTGAGNGTLGDLRYCIENAPSNSTIVFNVAAGSTIDLNSALTINNKNFTIDAQPVRHSHRRRQRRRAAANHQQLNPKWHQVTPCCHLA